MQQKAGPQEAVYREQRTHTTKVAQHAAKAGQNAALTAARAAEKSAMIAEQTRAAARKAAAKAKRSLAAAIRSITAATKVLIAAIAAGGWAAVAVIITVCMAALIAASCFGIFFSSEDTGSGKTMQQVVQEINVDYRDRIEAVKSTVSYDELEISGSYAPWSEILSVYAVRMTTDPDNPQEVATITPEKEQLLKNLFWEMNAIDYRTETETISADSSNGSTDAEHMETRTTLYITVSHKTTDEMAQLYGFGDEQNEQLALLLEQDSSMWDAVLGDAQ